MHEAEVILKPCPWCHKTPKLELPIDDSDMFGKTQTWLWKICCQTSECLMKPHSPHVSIRNTTKYTLHRLIAKLVELAKIWNAGNPIEAYEKVIVKLDKIKIRNL